MPIPFPMVTMAPSATPQIPRWLSCRTLRPPSTTLSCSRTVAHTTASIRLSPSFHRNDRGQEKIAWRHRLDRHQELSQHLARRHHNKHRMPASQVLLMEGTIFKEARHTSNSLAATIPRVRRLSCKTRCSIRKPYPNECRQAPRQCSLLRLKTSLLKHRLFPLNMGAGITPLRTEFMRTRRACRTQAPPANRSILRSPRVTKVPQ